MSKVYLSGPISGLTYYEARFGRRKEFADLLVPGIAVLSPMRHEGHLAEIDGPIEKAYPQNLFSHPKMIVTKDFLDIDESTLVIVDLVGAKRPSFGTMVELGYAKAKGKTIIVIIGPTDIHNHPFVNEVANVVVPTIEQAATIVNSLLSEGL